jgi:hypothetical protein
MTGMFEEVVRERDVRLEVVNLDPDALVGRLRSIGNSPDDVSGIGTDRCVEIFTDRLLDRRAEEFARTLEAQDPATGNRVGVMLAWGNPLATGGTRLTGVSEPAANGVLELEIDEPVPLGGSLDTGPWLQELILASKDRRESWLVCRQVAWSR